MTRVTGCMVIVSSAKKLYLDTEDRVAKIPQLVKAGVCMSIEIRVWVQSCEKIREQLNLLAATPKGDYAFTDYLYQSVGVPYNFNTEFVRIRVYHKTQWNQKMVVLCHKQKSPTDKRPVTIQQQEFDVLADAQRIISNTHRYLLRASRVGYEYSIGDVRVFVEDIERLSPSVEVLADSWADLNILLAALDHGDIIHDTVPHLLIQAIGTM